MTLNQYKGCFLHDLLGCNIAREEKQNLQEQNAGKGQREDSVSAKQQHHSISSMLSYLAGPSK